MILFYPGDLPVVSRKDEIISAIKKYPVVIVSGDTGSGKTTQLPKMCLEALGEECRLVGCTQPRRIAAASVAARVAEELGQSSNLVGYKIRFHDKTSKTTRIKFMTDGILLAETRQDRDLSRYSVIIIDEAHERSLNIDFLLGYLKQLLARRSDLKVIITSATIDTSAFASHFNKAPVISVTGRTYPVLVRHAPPSSDLDDESEVEHCVRAILDIAGKEPRGDILVFLPTEQDIRECCQELENRLGEYIILPLYSRLAGGDQQRIFQPHRKPKIVVATNIAETSITVPGIRYVVDSGLARISQYNARARTTSLPVTRISRASCEQRKGRCGRIGPGVCIRLYSEEDYLDRPEHTLPELKRSNLAEVILQMIDLQLGSPETFPFLDPPFKNSVREGFRTLLELGAITPAGQLTATGRIMADLPIDPSISRIIIAARDYNCLREIKILSAVLAIQDPRIRPAGQEERADTAHAGFAHPQSDFMALLNIWDQFHLVQEKVRSWSRLKKFCKANFLSFQRMREWFDLQDQLERILASRSGFTDNPESPGYEAVHRALLTGFLRNIARKKQGRIYQGTHEKELMIFPGSHQFMKGGEWLVAAAFIETSRLFALTVATVEVEWIEQIGEYLCKRSWSDPHWQKKTGRVMASETVTLFGLVLASGRKVDFARRSSKNIDEARKIFIQAGLVEAELTGKYPFLEHNQELLDTWRSSEEKLRVRNIVVDAMALYGFYDERLPRDVYDQQTLNRFLKKQKTQSCLMMTDEDVLQRRPDDRELFLFPASRRISGMEIRLEYSFQPGDEKDGVTFRLPALSLDAFAEEPFEWLVPGVLTEKVTHLLKGLPKSIRKKLVPVNETVDTLLDNLEQQTGSLYSALEAGIFKLFKVAVHRSDWNADLPRHLLPRFVVFDSSGNELDSSRNLRELKEKAKPANGSKNPAAPVMELRRKEQEIIERWQGSEHSDWNFANLPAMLTLYTSKGETAGLLHAALMAQPEKMSVKVIFEQDRNRAERLNREGLLLLYRCHFNDQYKALKKLCATIFSGPSALWLFSPGKTRQETINSLLLYIMAVVFGPLPGTIADEQSFRDNIAEVRKKGLFAEGERLCQEIMNLLKRRRKIVESIDQIFADQGKKSHYLPQKKDVFLACLNDILPIAFFFTIQPVPLANVDRYLQGLAIRLERFYADPGKDQQKETQLSPFLNHLAEIEKRRTPADSALQKLFDQYWRLIQEYRISLFAPELKTSLPVSPKKLTELWQTIQLGL